MKNVHAIVVAAGKGKRVGAEMNKLFLPLAGRPVLEHTLLAIKKSKCFETVYLVYRPREKGRVDRMAKAILGDRYVLVEGGEQRQDSVWNALKCLPDSSEIVAVHDGARCMVSPGLIRECVKSAKEFGSGVAGKRAVDTVKQIQNGKILSTIDRKTIALVETPQAFQTKLLKKAYKTAYAQHFLGTDEASLVERLGVQPRLVESVASNFKITHKTDFSLGEFYFMKEEPFRIGQGYDLHRMDKKRELILGGVKIDYAFGLLGHSDADVLVHAVIDALLGAAGLPDIGECFPDTEKAYKGVSSIKLLEKTGEMVAQAGYQVSNIDATLIMQAPKVSAYKAKMAKNIADALKISETKVSVKAKTAEHLGSVGRGEGIAASAVGLLFRNERGDGGLA